MPYIQLLTLISTLLFSATSFANDTADGQALHNKTCQRCHDNSIYTRPDSIIFSLTALEKRVRFCESMAGGGWSEQDMMAVINYLNQQFYHFKK